MSWITCRHHVLVVEHLLSQLVHSQGAVLLVVATGQRREAWDEEMKAREWNHINSQLSEIGVQLLRRTILPSVRDLISLA